MDLSIDMLSVGNGDAIVVWLKDDKSSAIVLVDGGNKSNGGEVIQHLETYVLPHVIQKAPDIIISTHPDKDHIGGLFDVVDYYKKNIKSILIHDPSAHMGNNYKLLKESAKKKSMAKGFDFIFESLEMREELVQKINSYGIPTMEPFFNNTSLNTSYIKILGPTEKYYASLLTGFKNIEEFLEKEASIENKMSQDMYSEILEMIENTLYDDNPCPVIDENNETTAENNSSVILEITIGNNRFLFTGDAGVQALLEVHLRTPLNNVFWLDLPHHGSRRNLSSELINIMKPQMVFVSAIGNKKHPRKALVNCLKKSGAIVYSTHNNGNMWYRVGNFPLRPLYKPLMAL